jgi:hypothetical protein
MPVLLSAVLLLLVPGQLCSSFPGTAPRQQATLQPLLAETTGLPAPDSAAQPLEVGPTAVPNAPSLCTPVKDLATDGLLLDSVVQTETTLYDLRRGVSYTGCRVQGVGDFRRVPDPERVLTGFFEQRQWERDIYNSADGPDGTQSAFRKGEQLCLYLLHWVGPDATDPEAELEPPWDTWYRAEFNCVEAPSGAQSLRRPEDVR